MCYNFKEEIGAKMVGIFMCDTFLYKISEVIFSLFYNIFQLKLSVMRDFVCLARIKI